MNAYILEDLFPSLPEEVIININDYLGIKSSKYIMEQMYELIYKNSNIQQWQQLIEDSKDVKIKMQFPVYYHKNLAVYLQTFISVCNLSADCVDCLGRFCINAIKNNPPIIYNQYELIPMKGPMRKDALPSIDLMVRYLVNRTVENKQIKSSIQKESMVFDIFSFILANRYINWKNISKLFYALHPGQLFTSKTVKALDLILSYPRQLIEEGFVEGQQQKNILSKLVKINQEFIISLFQKFDTTLEYYGKQYKKQYREKYFEQYKKEIVQNTGMFKQIIELLNNKHYEYIYDYANQICSTLIRKENLKLLQYLFTFSHFRNIILRSRFIFQVFYKRKCSYIKFIWSIQEIRPKISKMKRQDMNLLEYVCQSYGLTHNIICLLWDSGLFQTMPQIKNQKSRKIVKKKYEMETIS